MRTRLFGRKPENISLLCGYAGRRAIFFTKHLAKTHLPRLTVEMNRGDPFFEHDGAGWQFIDVHSGHVDLHYMLPGNSRCIMILNESKPLAPVKH